jgi:predicted dehydrogenase
MLANVMTTSRRYFVGAATAVSALRVWGANDRINLALVGLGGRGQNHLSIYSRLPESRVVALCDVNQAARERSQSVLAKAGQEKAKEFEDMREAFADKTVDAVSIATPNHWHALSAIWAMKAGKDVYGEKPASYNLHEGVELVKVARQTKRMFQVGSQHRSNPMKMKAMEAVNGGLIGKVYQSKGLCYKRRASIGRKPDLDQPPAGVNWDMFLGPAPLRKFNELRFRYNWHWFWDTGNGDIGNQGVHEMGIARWGMGDPEWPVAAYAHGGKFAYEDDQETPNTLTANFDYAGRELVFEVRGLLTGAEGGVLRGRRQGPETGTPAETAPKGAAPLNIMVGNLFYGTEGWAAMSDQGFQAFKGDSNEMVMELKPERGPNGGDPTSLHMQNFLAACRSRKSSDLHDEVGLAQVSAGLCHLANISYRVGRRLTLKAGPDFVNDAEASKMRTRSVYRKGYEV